MMTGGLIIKQQMTDEEVLGVLKRRVRTIPEPGTLAHVSGPEFHGVAIAHLPGHTFIFGRDITHSIAFEQNEASKLNDRLEALPEKPDILVFLINSVSDTYALARFSNGKMTAGKSFAEERLLSDFHTGKNIFEKVSMDEEGLLDCIQQFSGYHLYDLAEDTQTPVNAYIGS